MYSAFLSSMSYSSKLLNLRKSVGTPKSVANYSKVMIALEIPELVAGIRSLGSPMI